MPWKLTASGTFAFDPHWNPPRLQEIVDLGSQEAVRLGPGITLNVPKDVSKSDRLLDARVATDSDVTGLGSVRAGCAVFCNSNRCREDARRAGRPRMVAKVVGIDADPPAYVVLHQPRLRDTVRGRHESRASRSEAGLVAFVLIDPFPLECPRCGNRGSIAPMSKRFG